MFVEATEIQWHTNLTSQRCTLATSAEKDIPSKKCMSLKMGVSYARIALNLKLNNVIIMERNSIWIRPFKPTMYRMVDALKEQGFVYWNQNKNKYAVGDIIYIYASKPVQRIVAKVEVAAVDVIYVTGMDRDAEFAIDPASRTVENDRCIKIVPISYPSVVGPSYEYLMEIQVRSVQSANRLSAEQADCIDRML